MSRFMDLEHANNAYEQLMIANGRLQEERNAALKKAEEYSNNVTELVGKLVSAESRLKKARVAVVDITEYLRKYGL